MRAFIAIEIPEVVKEKITRLTKELTIPGITPVKREALHITLAFYEEISQERADSIKKALQEFKAEKFNASISGIGFFTPERIRVVFLNIGQGRDKIIKIYNSLASKFFDNNLPFGEAREYQPHITLARVKYLKDKDQFLRTLSKFSDFSTEPFEINNLTFKNSVLTDKGLIHTTLYECRF